jgi:asparagine synthetase B (glutamine-hydrolysing)
VALARGANRAEVNAVTWSFGGPGDDRPYLKELCEALGIVPLRISSKDASGGVVRTMVVDAAPSIWPTRAPLLMAQKWARELGADAILTGQGGDHVFKGDPRVFAQAALSGDWATAIRNFSRFYGDTQVRSAVRTAKLFATFFARRFPPIVRFRRRRFADHRWSWAGPRLRRFIAETYVRELDKGEWRKTTSEGRFQRLVVRDFLHIAESRGQLEAATGLMRIDPLLDDRLVSAVAGFPQKALLANGRSKGLLRQAMNLSLPERLRLRPDKARFECAIAELVQHSDLGELRSLATMRMCAQLGLVDPHRYKLEFEAMLRDGGASIASAYLWPALTVEAFVRSRWAQQERDDQWPAMQ